MPELPEVETVCRGLAPALTGHKITSVTVNRRKLRIPVPRDFEKTLTGSRIVKIRRRAKYIIMELDNGTSALWHLGMSGSMIISATMPVPAKHDHVIFQAGGKTITFNDPRRFGLVTADQTKNLADNKLLRHLGPEPLESGFNAKYLHEKLSTKKIAVKLAIMDQRLVVGVGNIYASEALFAARIDPRRSALTITREEAATLARAIKAVLKRAIAAGGSSLRDYVQADGELGYFQHAWAVYNKKGKACPGCRCTLAKTGGIAKIIQGGRATFYCPVRQG